MNFKKIIFERKLLLLNNFARLLFGDYRVVWPQLDWWKSEEFNRYLDKFNEKNGFNTPRKWMLGQLLRLTVNVPGDTVECGVYRGASSWLICNSNKKNSSLNKVHHIFDSFEGLSLPDADVDGKHWAAGNLSVPETIVSDNLSNFIASIKIYKGWIPDRFDEVKELTFSFVHIDVDLYEPTRDSLSFFYSRVNNGGIILCDDYRFSSCPGATKAVDEFLEDKPEKMIALGAGGGFLIKGVQTAQG